MYLFFPTFRLNLSFLSQIQDDAKVEFTALKGSLEPPDNGIPVKKYRLPVLDLKLTGCSNSFTMSVCGQASKKIQSTSSKGEITSQIPPLHLQCSVAVEKMLSKWAG